MVNRAEESRAESNVEIKCDLNLDTILPIGDVSSLNQLKVKLQNRSFKILLVIHVVAWCFIKFHFGFTDMSIEEIVSDCS